MRRKIILLVVMATLLAISAIVITYSNIGQNSDQQGGEQDLVAHYDSNNNEYVVSGSTLTIAPGVSGTGVMPNFSLSSTVRDLVGEDFVSVIIGSGITRIGNMAFANYSLLATIVLSDTVTSLGESIFWGCTALSSITLSNNIGSVSYGLFNGCTSLTSITIPNSVTFIGGVSFSGCTGLTNISLSNNITSIGESAFSACQAYATEIVLPESVESIGRSAFMGCTQMPSIVIGSNVTSIGASAFYACNNLDKITIKADDPPSVGATSGTDYTFPSSTVFYVKYASLSDYESDRNYNSHTIYTYDYTEVEGIDGLTYAYNKLTKVLEVSGSGEMTSLSSGLISHTPTSIGNTTNVRDLTSLIVYSDVQTIHTTACAHCHDLVSVTLPSSVVRIESLAFNDCTSLSDVTFSEGLEEIGVNAFEGDTLLGPRISLPTTLLKVGDYAFKNCTGITSISLKSETDMGTGAIATTSLVSLTISGPYVHRYSLPNTVTTIYVQYIFKSGYDTYYANIDVVGVYLIKYFFSDATIYEDTSISDEYTLKYDNSGQFHTTYLWQQYQSSSYLDASITGGTKVILNKVYNAFYAVRAPSRVTDVARVVITAGPYSALDFGEIQSITDNYTSQLTTLPIPPKGYSGTFTMDTGVQRQITVNYKRVAPASPNDSSTDSKDWSNTKWKRILDQYTDRWQMETNGCRLHIVAPDDATMENEYTFTDYYDEDEEEWIEDDMGINAYISSAPVEYSNSTMYAIEESITFKIGTIYPHPKEAPTVTVNLKDGVNTTMGVATFPANTWTLLPFAPAKYQTTNNKYLSGWAKNSGDTTATLGMPGDPFETGNTSLDIYGIFLNMSNGELYDYDRGSTTSYSVTLAYGHKYYIYMVGGGGAGGKGAGCNSLASSTEMSSGAYAGGGGGASGEYYYFVYDLISSSTDETMTITLGEGGVYGTDGGDGGDTIISITGGTTTTHSVNGGAGGGDAITTAGSGIAKATGGAGGDASSHPGANGGNGGNGYFERSSSNKYIYAAGASGDHMSTGDTTQPGSGSIGEYNGIVYTYGACVAGGAGGGGAPQLYPGATPSTGSGFYGGAAGAYTGEYFDLNPGTLQAIPVPRGTLPADGKHGGGGGGSVYAYAEGSTSILVNTPGKGGCGYVYIVTE